jgi:hypothetical protein
MDTKTQIASATGQLVPEKSSDHAYVELSRSKEFQDVYTAAAKIRCEDQVALSYLEKCGFKKAKRMFFPTDLSDQGVSWWPHQIDESNVFIKEEGSKGFASAVWIDGVLYLYLVRQ